MDLNNVKLVTHAACSDGSASSVLFLASGGLEENIIFSSPNHDDVDDIAKDLFYNWEGPIWFVDISVSFDIATLLSTRNDIVLIDHHKSAIPLSKFNFCTIDENNKSCGSKLFFNFLKKNWHAHIDRYKLFIDAVDDIDRWQNQIPESKVIHVLHNIYSQKLFIKRFLNSTYPALTDNEQFVVELDKQKEKDYVARKKQEVVIRNLVIESKDVKVGFVNAGGPYRNVLGHEMCEDLDLNLDLAVMINGEYISLRSRGNVDCSRIAQMNGGGGHTGAAGLNLSKVLNKDLIELVIENIKT